MSSLGPRPQIHPTAHIADKCTLIIPPSAALPTDQAPPTSPIIIGAQTILHPFSILTSLHSNLIIGAKCQIWEKANIGNIPSDNGLDQSGRAQKVTTLDDNVIVHPFATVCAGAQIGRGSVIGIRATVGVGAMLGEDVVVTSAGVVRDGARVESGAVVGPRGVVRQGRRRHGAFKDEELLKDLDRLDELRVMGREKERELGFKLVKGRAGGGGIVNTGVKA